MSTGRESWDGARYEERRRRALLAGGLFLVVHGLYTGLQCGSLFLGLLPGQVARDVFLQSIYVNAFLDLAALIFLLVQLRPGPTERAERGLFWGAVGLTLVLNMGWTIQLHFGGSQSSHVLPLIIGTLLVVSWLLPRGTTICLAFATTGMVVGLVTLELTDVLPYSPLLLGDAGMEALYRDWHIVAMNACIYACTMGLTLGIMFRMQGVVARSRLRLAEQNRVLASEATRRERSEATLQRAVEELQRTNGGLRHFIQAAAHDLRSPLTAIGGYTSLLQKRVGDQLDDRSQTHAQRIQEGIQQMSRLLDDLAHLVLSRQREVTLEPASTAEIIQRLKGLMQHQLDESGGTLETGELPMVLADEGRLFQVFQNLLVNALKFRSDSPPRIRVEAHRNAHEWTFAVHDNGEGIPRSDRQRVFEPFERLKSRTECDGSGIGLSVCKNAIQAMGGSIWIEDGKLGGTSFYFTLPAVGGSE